MYQHLLLPTDGSPLSQHAATDGVALAARLGARVTTVFVAPAPTPLVFEGLLPVAYMTPEQHAEWVNKAAERALGRIQHAAVAAGVPCDRVQLVSEYPAEAIVATAKKRKCDLIVMASHGRRGVKALLLGSETAKVLAHSTIPVLVHR
jgi:nucleotide-binding universal stress UspA family protein